MITALADRISAARERAGVRWKIWAAVLIAVLVVIGGVVMWWRRQAAARREHEAFVARVDADRLADQARADADAAKLTQLDAVAREAEQDAILARQEADAARSRHEDDLAAIARVRSWDDVGRDR